jgi:serine/threonine protein kinase
MEQNVNQDIIDGLINLYHQRYDAYYEARNRRQEEKALNLLSRANRYKNVIQKISDHPSRITSGAEAQRLFKFGNKIKSEIDAIIKQRIVIEEEQEPPEFLEEIARLEEEHAWETNPEVWEEIARLEDEAMRKRRKQMGGSSQKDILHYRQLFQFCNKNLLNEKRKLLVAKKQKTPSKKTIEELKKKVRARERQCKLAKEKLSRLTRSLRQQPQSQVGGDVAIREPYEFEIVELDQAPGTCGRKNKRYLKGRGDSIGSGVQAQVFELCTTKEECSKFAIKVFTGGDDAEFDYTKEAEIMAHLRDHDVSPLIYDAWSCEDTYYIIMDQFTGPTLAEMTINGKTIKEKYIRDLAETIRIMHEEANVVHGDLHLNNIVWDKEAKRFFIIDFSMSSMDYDEDEA